MSNVAIVTGGTRGIGLGIAECLARDGYDLVLGYNSNAQRAQQTKASIEEKHGVRVQVVAGDIAEPATINMLFGTARELVKTASADKLHVVYIHNAGLTALTAARLLGLPYGEPWDAHLYEYFQKVYCHSFRRAINLGKATPGFSRVVAVSSVGCNACQNPTGLYYEAPGHAKASLEYLVRVFAKLLAKDGITVNTIIPGPIETEAWDDLVKATGMDLEKFIASTPAQRWASPTEVGEVVAFLCSPRAAFINGVALPIDGGLHLGPVQ
ncbi:hypothetical protein WJX81_002156 [Elliptochloris bilobata]|uniref:3-oxoacyl-[acyl-carrier-protein] reductase n=1 Tax=Elliptochloris bilobata TaxID=381761 RepID=A0AAW1RZN3_9CHLO